MATLLTNLNDYWEFVFFAWDEGQRRMYMRRKCAEPGQVAGIVQELTRWQQNERRRRPPAFFPHIVQLRDRIRARADSPTLTAHLDDDENDPMVAFLQGEEFARYKRARQAINAVSYLMRCMGVPPRAPSLLSLHHVDSAVVACSN